MNRVNNLSDSELTKVIKALNNYVSTLKNDSETVKDYHHLKVDFENQMNEINPIIVKLENQLEEVLV